MGRLSVLDKAKNTVRRRKKKLAEAERDKCSAARITRLRREVRQAEQKLDPLWAEGKPQRDQDEFAWGWAHTPYSHKRGRYQAEQNTVLNHALLRSLRELGGLKDHGGKATQEQVVTHAYEWLESQRWAVSITVKADGPVVSGSKKRPPILRQPSIERKIEVAIERRGEKVLDIRLRKLCDTKAPQKQKKRKTAKVII